MWNSYSILLDSTIESKGKEDHSSSSRARLLAGVSICVTLGRYMYLASGGREATSPGARASEEVKNAQSPSPHLSGSDPGASATL